MNRSCEKRNDSPMPIYFHRLALSRGYVESLETPKPESFDSPDGKKNDLWSLRYGTLDLLRPQSPIGSRPPLRRHAGLPRTGNPTGSVPEVWQGEAGEVCLFGQQSVLHQAVCFLRREALQYLHGQRCAPGAASGPKNGQCSGKAIHAGEAPPCRQCQTQDYRY